MQKATSTDAVAQTKRQPVRAFGRNAFNTAKRAILIAGGTILLARAVSAQTAPTIPTPADSTSKDSTNSSMALIPHYSIKGGYTKGMFGLQQDGVRHSLGADFRMRSGDLAWSAGIEANTFKQVQNFQPGGQPTLSNLTAGFRANGGINYAPQSSTTNGEVSLGTEAGPGTNPVPNPFSLEGAAFHEQKFGNLGITGSVGVSHMSSQDSAHTTTTGGHAFIGIRARFKRFMLGVFGGWNRLANPSQIGAATDARNASTFAADGLAVGIESRLQLGVDETIAASVITNKLNTGGNTTQYIGAIATYKNDSFVVRAEGFYGKALGNMYQNEYNIGVAPKTYSVGATFGKIISIGGW